MRSTPFYKLALLGLILPMVVICASVPPKGAYSQMGVNPALTTLPANTWVKMNPQVFDAAGNDITAIGIPYNDYSGMTYSPDDSAILMFGGGGHGGRRGNEVWLYDIPRNVWRAQYAPDPPSNYPYSVDDSGMTKDEYCQYHTPCTPLPQWLPRGSTSTKRPWTSHSNDRLSYDTFNKRLIFHSPAFCFGKQMIYYYRWADTYSYNVATKTWTYLTTGPGEDHWSGGATEYDPANKVVVSAIQDRVYQFNVTTNVWTLKAKSPAGFFHTNMVYDTVTGAILGYGADYAGCVDCASSRLWAYQAVKDTWTLKTPSPDPLYGTPPAGTPNAAFDSTHGVMLLWGQGDTGSFIPTWVYDVRTNAWKKMNPIGGEPATAAGPSAHLIYDPVNDVFFLVRSTGKYGTVNGLYSYLGELWAYRYAPSISTPDTTPPTVTVTSPTQGATLSGAAVALVATASDNTAVAGVQFKVDGQNAGLEDTAAPYGITWNSLLVANAQHTVTALARDMSGNTATSVGITITVSNSVSPPQNTGIADINAILSNPSDPKPQLKASYIDPVFNTCVMRISDSVALGTNEGVPVYSELQAWNADETKIFLQSHHILNANDYSLYSKIPYMESPKWSPINPNILYSTKGNSFIQYDIARGVLTTLHTFTEYSNLQRNAAFQELSQDGRYTAMMGIARDGTAEVFSYDIVNDIKSPVSVVSGHSCGLPDWVSVSPLGKYVIVDWAGGGDQRYCTVEAYDLNMNFVGTVATGHGHGSLTVDQNGVEWFVDFSPDNYVGITGPVIKKNRIPDGYSAYKAGIPGTIEVLLRVDWSHSMHISGLVSRAGWVIASTYSGSANGWQAMEQEIIKVYLDSTLTTPHVKRLAHHRSDYNYVASSCATSSYWAQPHATVNRSGTKILFGSTWGQNCIPDSYLLDLTCGSSNSIPPQSPTVLKIIK